MSNFPATEEELVKMLAKAALAGYMLSGEGNNWEYPMRQNRLPSDMVSLARELVQEATKVANTNNTHFAVMVDLAAEISDILLCSEDVVEG